MIYLLVNTDKGRVEKYVLARRVREVPLYALRQRTAQCLTPPLISAAGVILVIHTGAL